MVFIILGWTLAVFVVLGNGFVVYLIVNRQRLHTKPNWFVLSLAIADFFVGATFFPLIFICTTHAFPLCSHKHFHWLCVDVFLCSSVTNLCLMTADRYVAIVKPLKYLTVITVKRAVLAIFVAWFIPILTAIAPSTWEYTASKENVNASWELFTVCTLIFYGALPCIGLPLALYPILLIVRKCRRDWSTVNAQLNFNYPGSRCRKHAKRTRELSSAYVIITIVILYELCHLVSACVRILIVFGHRVPLYVTYISTILILINSAANPVAYALLKGDIKQELIKMRQNNRLLKFKSNICKSNRAVPLCGLFSIQE